MNKIHFYGFINPYIYILFILMLPFETPGWLLLLLSFATGLTVDMFSGVLGLHTAATVFVAFLRPYIIRLVGEKPDYDNTTQPSLNDMGFKWFGAYTFTMILIHSLAINYLDVFSFGEFFKTLLRSFASALFTFLISTLLVYIFAPAKEK